MDSQRPVLRLRRFDGGEDRPMPPLGIDGATPELRIDAFAPIRDVIATVRAASKGREGDRALAGLLRRMARRLHAVVYFSASGGCQGPVTGGAAIRRKRGAIAATQVAAALGETIEQVRASGETALPTLPLPARVVLGNAHAMIGTVSLATGGEPQTGVWIALRDRGAAAFGDADRIAADLLALVGEKELEAERVRAQLARSADETLWLLANVIDARDNSMAGHSQRVARLARMTGAALGLPEAELATLERAGALHDIGKLGVAERILNKPGKLTAVEFEQVKQHPRIGVELLRPVTSLRPILDAVLYHHENHDGSGYPDGLAGEEIPLAARILHVADIFDALTSERPYRKAMPIGETLAELERGAGTVTDPDVTRTFIAAMREEADAPHPALSPRTGRRFKAHS